jgi:HEAT repeat protein
LHNAVARPCRRLATAALICALPLAAARAERPGQDGRELSRAEQRMVRVLRATRAKPPPPVEESRKLVARDAHPAVGVLLDVLEQRQVPAIDGLPLQRLSTAQEELALGGLRVIGREGVMRALDPRLAASTAAATRAMAIEVYGVFGDADDLNTIVALAGGTGDDPLDGHTDELLQQTLTNVLTSDARAFDRLRAVLKGKSRDVLIAIVFAVGAARDERGLPFLAEIMTWRDDLAVEALSQIRLIGRSSSPAVDAELSQLARVWLDPHAATRCRAAIMALGVLEDENAVPQLIELLEQDSRGMRDEVLWSLRRISGQQFPASRTTWIDWHAAEESWYEERWSRCVGDLGSDDEEEFTSAVQELAQHRLYRHAIAQALCPALERDKPEFRQLVCAALADLGSTVAVRALTDVLDDDDEHVAESARAALLKITGRDPRPAEQQH